ncbi:MAG: DUF2911 domain-containing protein [Roseivirga sp.]|nr:DUF2911 domain-containing protein [Roseivirga sp.]
MKKIFTLLFSMSLLMTVQSVMAQRGPAASPKATVSQAIGNTQMEIVYHRPSLDGRDVSTLVNDKPNGEVWRTGANNNTLISFSKDVTVGGQSLKAGQYSLFTIPGNGEWTIIFNSTTDKWGTQYNKSTDVLRIKAKATTSKTEVETFTINMTDFDKNSKDKANIELAWGNISVKFDVKVTN